MSRTFRHKKYKYTQEKAESDLEYSEYRYNNWVKVGGVKTKKKRNHTTYWQNLYTRAPGWFVRNIMNRPARRKAHMLERLCVRSSNLEDIDFFVVEDCSFIYYY